MGRKKASKPRRPRAGQARPSREARELGKLDQAGERLVAELAEAYAAAPIAERKAFTALASDVLGAVGSHPGGLERARQIIGRMVGAGGSFGDEKGPVGPLVDTAFAAVRRDPPGVCRHIERGPLPGALCYQHLGAGVLCGPCWHAHVAGHTREEEFTCDVCGALTDGLRGCSSVPQVGLPLRISGATRVNPEPVTLNGIGVCTRCYPGPQDATG